MARDALVQHDQLGNEGDQSIAATKGRVRSPQLGLREYGHKRDFARTPEPKPRRAAAGGRRFVVQKHRATQLHYDFRLEVGGALRSWAVPKGASFDPSVKRLAMAVEDHPLEYAEFEGVIPAGEYGGGTVMIWDEGTYAPLDADDAEAGLQRGELRFVLNGKKLKGGWTLVRTGPRAWLLIKRRDRFARTTDITRTRPRSVRTRRLLADIARDAGGDVERAKTGDP